MLRWMAHPPDVTLLVVGDIHRHWRPEDATFLKSGHQELTMFVGDLGDEDLEIVQTVAAIDIPKVVMLGNHDAWQSFSNKAPTSNLRKSIELLGADHLAYGVRELPRAGISIIGARPFSWGGASLRSPEIYGEFYGVTDMRSSAARIVEAARKAQHRDLLVLAHNGPTGLGEGPQDIYGKDFGKPGGDWGDKDLDQALGQIQELGLRVRCVVAGHMHHRTLRPRGGIRTRFVRRGATLFANPAVVPRLRKVAGGVELSHFLRMRWQGGTLTGMEEIWVEPGGEVREVSEPSVLELVP